MKRLAEVPSIQRKRLLVFSAVAIAISVATAWVIWPSGPSGKANPNDALQVARGDVVYRQYCASCHGTKLEGQPDWRIRKPDGKLPAPPHDESGHTWHHPDQQLFVLIKRGLSPPLAPDGYKSDMPAFAGTLTDEDIWAALAFIKHSWPPEVQARQRSRDDAARRP